MVVGKRKVSMWKKGRWERTKVVEKGRWERGKTGAGGGGGSGGGKEERVEGSKRRWLWKKR